MVQKPRKFGISSANAGIIHHRKPRSHGLSKPKTRYWATIGAINEQFVNIPEQIIRQYPMLLSGGMWGTIDLTYDETEIHNKKIRPFKIMAFTPFQISVINVDEFITKRKQFTTDEWIDILINSQGLNPGILTRRQKLLYICRFLPLIETNVNMIELGPREPERPTCTGIFPITGKFFQGEKPPQPALHQPQYRAGRDGRDQGRCGFR